MGEKISQLEHSARRAASSRIRFAGRNGSTLTIVVLPEYVAKHWWDRVLYNQTAKRLKAALVGREHTVIADVPYRREH